MPYNHCKSQSVGVKVVYLIFRCVLLVAGGRRVLKRDGLDDG
jgi:hypothetical protein